MRDFDVSASTATTNRPAEATLARFGEERLQALLAAVGSRGEAAPILAAFHALVRPWGARRIGRRPSFPSNVADDGAPYEFSLALSPDSAEVQFYVEPQGDPPGAATNMRAGKATLELVAREFGAELAPIRAVEDIFLPPQPEPPFPIWIGASYLPGCALKFKAYLNPEVQGRSRADELVTSAMSRWGHARAWSAVRDALSVVPDRSDEVGIVALDLSAGPEARVKLYVRQKRATLADVRRLAEIATDYDAEDVDRFYGALAGHPGPFLAKPVITELTFRRRGAARPDSVTVEFPIQSYVANDDVARRRICRCLNDFGVRSAPYERAIQAFSTRPLERASAIHAHVTLRRVPSSASKLVRRIGVYLTSEAYATGEGSAEHG
jgi:DMATS type aromatic prenyltransferase